MTAIILNQVADSAQSLTDLVIGFDPTQCTERELSELIRLGEKLEGIGITLLSKAESKYAWEASAGLRFKVAATTSKVIAMEEVLLPKSFRRSLKAIFVGPESLLQSLSLRQSRHKNFERRCKKLRKLSPNAIVTWALTFSPNSWFVHNMRNDIFSCLVTVVESRPKKMWPSKVYELLEGLKIDMDLAQNFEYLRFVSDLNISAPNENGAERDVSSPQRTSLKRARTKEYDGEEFVSASCTPLPHLDQH